MSGGLVDIDQTDDGKLMPAFTHLRTHLQPVERDVFVQDLGVVFEHHSNAHVVPTSSPILLHDFPVNS